MNEFLLRTLSDQKPGAGRWPARWSESRSPSPTRWPPPAFRVQPSTPRPCSNRFAAPKIRTNSTSSAANIAVTEAIHAASRDIVEPGMTEWDVYRAIHDVAPRSRRRRTGHALRRDRQPAPESRAAVSHGAGSLGHWSFSTCSRCSSAIGRTSPTRWRSVAGVRRRASASCSPSASRRWRPARRALRPGVRACDVYAAVRASFAEAGEESLFPHHAGHGIGLNHPEAPHFIPQRSIAAGGG